MDAYVIVDYEGGVRACLDLCMFAEVGDEQQLTAVGDGGKVEAFIPSGRLVIGDRSAMTSTEVDVITDERVAHTGYHHGASYLEHLAFIDAIRTGGAAAVTVHDGLASVALGVAAHRSIDEARVVAMAEFGI